MQSFFANPPTANDVLGALFLRINNLSVSAKASATDLSFTLFETPAIGIDEGEFLLSAGAKLSSPFELSLDTSGGPDNGIKFSETVKARLAYEPFGSLHTRLPFTVVLNGIEQNLTILFEDEDLFDDRELLVKVDFDVCQLDNVFQALLSKAGAMSVSAQNIVGDALPSNLDGIVNSIDDLLPNVDQFFEGVLEGEIFLLRCLLALGYASCTYAK